MYSGVHYERNENCVLKIDKLNTDYLGLSEAKYVIDKAHRTGPNRGNVPRDIIVRFKSHSASDITHDKRSQFRGGLELVSCVIYPKVRS